LALLHKVNLILSIKNSEFHRKKQMGSLCAPPRVLWVDVVGQQSARTLFELLDWRMQNG
jgi:hypothetical protein